MATPATIEELRLAGTGAVRLATADLDAFWRSLSLDHPEATRDALLRFLPALVEQYGEAAAGAAADWYDELRETEGVPGRFSARMAEPVSPERVEQRVRFGAQHLFTDDPVQTLVFLTSALTKYVLEPSRATIAISTAADPAASGWHRETRAGACDFCRMLAGRGGVYKRQTARFAAHDDCACVAVPSWDANAREVPVVAYTASQRTSGMSDAQRERHNALIRRAIEQYVH